VLLDEVDGINSREDQGALPTILQIIRETKFPVILTANDPWDQKIRSLREACLLIEFKRLGLRDGIPLLKTILDSEGVQATDDSLKLLMDYDQGDIRSALNDLQILSSRAKFLTTADIALLSGRDRTQSIFHVLATIFNSKTILSSRKALDASEIDHEMLLQWISENIPYQIPVHKEMGAAISAIAEADMFLARIKRTQAWRLLSYALELMTAGVALSKQTPLRTWTQMRFPQRISAMSRTRVAREIRKQASASIGARGHVSIRRAYDLYFPTIRFIYEHNPEQYERLANWLNAKEQLDALVSGEAKLSN
jgi:replication factor C large subunit